MHHLSRSFRSQRNRGFEMRPYVSSALRLSMAAKSERVLSSLPSSVSSNGNHSTTIFRLRRGQFVERGIANGIGVEEEF